jgi:hypothetical protein
MLLNYCQTQNPEALEIKDTHFKNRGVLNLIFIVLNLEAGTGLRRAMLLLLMMIRKD